MTKIIDTQNIEVDGFNFTCIACELEIDVSSFIFNPDLSSSGNKQKRIAILLSHSDSVLQPENTPIQMIVLPNEKEPNRGEPSSSIDTACVSCGVTVNKGYTTVGFKAGPEEVMSSTKIEFSNSTICPFCEDCMGLYAEAYDKMKLESVDLTTHVI